MYDKQTQSSCIHFFSFFFYQVCDALPTAGKKITGVAYC